MNKNQSEFLSKDNIGLKEGTFSTTKHIAQLLIKKENIQEAYKIYSERENQCEELISQVIDSRYNAFNPLVQKPGIYGESYDRLKQHIKQNRRRLSKSKELLSTKSVDLKQTYYNQVYCKQIMEMLEKLHNIRQNIVLMENTYEGCLEYRKTKMMLNSFAQQKSVQIQHLSQCLNDKGTQILNQFNVQLKKFFFGDCDDLFKQGDAKKYHDAQLMTVFNIDLLPTVKVENDEELELCLIDTNEQQNGQLMNFIKNAFQFNDFEQIKTYLDAHTNRSGDIELSHKMNGNLMSIFLSVKGCLLLKETNRFLNQHFQDFKYNMQDMFTKILVLFVKKSNKNTHKQDGLFGELSFTNISHYQAVTQFFKKLMAYLIILLRKQVIFGKILHYFNVDVDENTLLLSLSELCRQLFWQINIILSMFYKKSSTTINQRDLLDIRNEFHLFVNTALNMNIPPSPLYYLLQRQLLDQSLMACIEALKQFMRMEPIFKEPIENEVHLQRELNKNIYEECVKQVFEATKTVVRKSIISSSHFIPTFQFEHNIHGSDLKLNEMIDTAPIEAYSTLKMQIPECLKISGIITQLVAINRLTELKEDFPSILGWILGVMAQECKSKLKNCVSGSFSEQMLYNPEKVGFQKKLLSYMEWKVQFQQNNSLLNDGINTAARLEKALKDKQFKRQMKSTLYQGYKEFLIGNQKDCCLIKSKEIVHSICALHDNISVFLVLCQQAILEYLKIIDIPFLIRSLEIQGKDIDEDKVRIIRNFQLRCEQQGIKLSTSTYKNAFEASYKDNYMESIYRLIQHYNAIFQVQLDCYIILRYEFHLRCLLMPGIQDFYFDFQNFSAYLRESMIPQNVSIILRDYWTLFKSCVKSQFIREKDFNPKKIQMILKDLNVLKDGEDFKRIAHLRRYFKLYLVQPLDIEKFLALNPFKYKLTTLQEYSQLRACDTTKLTKYCL